MSPRADKVISAFLVLNTEDKKKVVDFTSQFFGKTPIVIDDRRQLVITSLLSVLAGHEVRISEKALIDQIETRKLWRNVDRVVDVVYEISGGNGGSKKVAIFLLSLVADDCKKRSQSRAVKKDVLDQIESPTIRRMVSRLRGDPIPFSVVRVLQRMGSCTDILSTSFPGYNASLIRHFVLEGL